MLKRRLILIVGIGVILLPHPALAISSKAGEAGANFLKIGISPRASAMGEAFCAIADDVNSIYYNPAGLTQIKQRTSALMHTDWLEEVNYEFLAYTEPYGSKKTLGLSLSYLGMSKMERKDINNVVIGDFEAGDLALVLSYAQVVNDRISAGANVKFIQQELEDEISASSAVDVGILFKQNALSLGACVSNLGTRIKFIKEKEKLPLNLKLGLGYKLLDNRVILALDINRPVDNDINFGVGTEYQATNNLFVRAGYNSKNDVGNGISLGCGFRVKNFYLDYSFLPYEQMGDVHRFSLQFKISEPVESKILSKESNRTILEKTTSLPEQEVEKKASELPKETSSSPLPPPEGDMIKKPSKEVTHWIKGERYKVTEGSVSGGNQVWLRIGTPKSRQTYSLDNGTQVKYLGEEKSGFYKVVVTSEGVYKGRQGWIWGGSFEKSED